MTTPYPDYFSDARTQLLIGDPRRAFWAVLAMHLRSVPTFEVETLRVDGTTCWWNPEFMAGLTAEQRIFCVAHEVHHCALGHMYRQGHRDGEQWNIACDHVINLDLKQSGFDTSIKGICLDPQYKGMASETVYSMLQAQPQQQPKQGQQGQGTPQVGAGQSQGKDGQEMEAIGVPGPGPLVPGCPTGDFIPGTTEETVEQQMTEADWCIAVEQAIKVASAAGTVPGSLMGQVSQARQPKIDWASQLREFISQVTPADYTWMSPNRRFVADGVYMPGVKNNNLGIIAVMVDTSGSTQRMRQLFADEFGGIVTEARPEKVIMVYCDAKVHRVDEITPDDFELEMHNVGNGGTAFQPAFDCIAETGEQIVAAIYLTDGEACDTPVEPNYPVLWVTPDYCKAYAPFGQCIQVVDDAK